MRLVYSLVAAGVSAGLLLFGSFGTSHAAVVENFQSGGWNGSAFTDDQTGAFSTCVASVSYHSGITLYVQLDTNYNWAIGFSALQWNMKVGADIALQYRIDRGAWQSGVAKRRRRIWRACKCPEAATSSPDFAADGHFTFEMAPTITNSA